ncbi:aldehyde dehydrogenase family protein [Saccharopolyspora erythraea]|uniref:Glycine betaine aldehyde dehydrogenase n=1 Tax=Saccharopolyspora erythraea (strain ATCC 11635 / DSM 40517 / JCM 4748 / NBRC 13426 / NCIMB 8594 / NRRL 2338) TaxID=405948 RepID=A4FHE7_SACEN|nr:aldehyde dehydrogenase family protein [Saccharopolyspora erythraea]QRK87370.1 aldehyde dehydrogenase family protein [Saccharopolyspora erythraea]CAM03472.1 glycine betaine aldehyde dehydrogenase [Saccharopolyspora erythraea NRRL 2338]
MPSLYVDGRWTASQNGREREVINPFDASVLTTVDEADETDVDRAVRAARRAFDDGDWAFGPSKRRAEVLRAVAGMLQRDKEAIARAETLDTGKTIAEARIDVDDVTAAFSYYADMTGKDAGRNVDAGPDAVSRVVYEPVGVCSLIAPWNYPLLQASWKVAPALAAGNTFVLKPSEITPLSTIRMVELLEEAGGPPGVVNLVLGDGATVGAAMVSHPEVDLVSFTGGLLTGRKIMASAAEGVKKVALELGGKNPNVVCADADFETAVDYALAAAFLDSGQVCSAGSRLIVADELHDRFVAELADRAERIRVGDGLDPDSETGPLVSAEHLAKVEKYVEIARGEGARLVTGGRRPDDPKLASGFFLLPTVFADCERGMRVVQEEVFGPVVTVERFRTEDEAVELANDTRYGLTGAVWTNDASRAQRMANRLRHGTIWINDFHPYLPQAEWGGFGQSGVGRELGPSGLDEYREAKHIYQNIRPEPMRWFRG